MALELLRQCCLVSRSADAHGRPLLVPDLVLIVEAADLILPEAPVTGLGDADRQRLHICHDWFADPGFAAGGDVVVLLAESTGALNQRIRRLPQVVPIDIDEPDRVARRAYLAHAAGGAAALAGCAVAGPIGVGKTFIFEAMAGELGLPVLELGNIRSQWFGQTDVILERLRRVLVSLERVVIIVDEADTQFGGVGPEAHATERRLTGRIQAMMSDPQLLGKVFWLLMTARIHRLSPDLRRPGRVGDLIVPVLDPEPTERRAFVRWAVAPALSTPDDALLDHLAAVTADYAAADYAAAGYAALRRECAGRAALGPVTGDDVRALVADLLPAAIARTRRYQTLQVLVNTTRRSLLPDLEVDDAIRAAWQEELHRLEAAGER